MGTHNGDRRLCKRCVIEKNLSWLAAALMPILSDTSFDKRVWLGFY